ncbi:unnamed protein product [Lampetra planeri]
MQRLGDGASVGPPEETTAAITDTGATSAISHASATTRQAAAILDVAAGKRSGATISEVPRGAHPAAAAAVVRDRAARRGRRRRYFAALKERVLEPWGEHAVAAASGGGIQSYPLPLGRVAVVSDELRRVFVVLCLRRFGFFFSSQDSSTCHP